MKANVHFLPWLALLVLAGALTIGAQAQNPTITIHATDSQAAEAFSDTGTFTVRRTGATNFSVLVFYELSGSASNGVDYLQLGGTVEIPSGATSASFTVAPVDDNLTEGTEIARARIMPSPLQCPTCGYDIGTPNVAEILIEDNDRDGTNQPPVLNFYQPQNGQVFTAPADIRLQAFAQDREDRHHIKVEFFEGERSLGFGEFVPALCPAPYCPYFVLVWSNVPPGVYDLTAKATDSAGAITVSEVARVTVIDSNRPPVIVNILATDDTGSEIAPVPPWLDIPDRIDPAVFTVIRTGPTNDPLTVYYSVGGTASNGADYVGLSGDVTIPAGASSANVEVAVLDDFLVEGTETVALTVQAPTCPAIHPPPPWCYSVGPQNSAVAQILDNDPGPTNQPPFVRLDVPEEGQVFACQGPTNIYLQAFAQDLEDGYFVGVEFFEGARSLGQGTFNPTRCWPGCPNYILTWSNVPPGRYVLTAVATDHHGATGTSAPVSITVIDTRPFGAVNVYATDPVAAETPLVSTVPPDTGKFTVRRDDAGTNFGIVVFYEISGTASNGVDYARLSGHVALPAGVSSADIVVSPIDDLIAEGIESVVVTLIPQCPQCLFAFPPCLPPVGTNCFPLGPHYSAAVSLLDNDEAAELPLVNIVARDPTASEGGGFWWVDAQEQSTGLDVANRWDVNRGGTNTATFVVRRHGPTNTPLVVHYEIGGTASNGVDYAALSESVAIDAGRRTARIVVMPIDDAQVEGIESVQLTIKSSGDYRIGLPGRASAVIVDNDRPRPLCRMVSHAEFHLCTPATNGFCFRIEASANLIYWTPVCTNVVTDGALHFVDPDASLSAARFYRVVSEPELLPDD